MANVQLLVGLPSVDWRQSTVDALANGTFGVANTDASVVSLTFGNIVLEISGTGIDTDAGRSITDGTIDSIKLIVDGDDVATVAGFSITYTAALFQAVLDDPPANVWDDFAAFIAAEPLNVVGSPDEDWILGGTGNDTIAGGEERDFIFSGAGDDEITAIDTERHWGDYIQPGLGTNVIFGSEVRAPDGYVDGHDLTFSDLVVAVKVNLKNGIATATGMHTTFSEVHWVAGGAGDDSMTGGASKFNKEGFSGMVGDDTMNGRGGYDEVSYQEESAVGSVNGSGVWTVGTKGAKVDLEAGTATDSFGDSDTLISIEGVRGTKFKDTILGSSSNNNLMGFEGADKLDGRAGFDTIEGGGGRDTLTGGGNVDVFLYLDVSESGASATKRDYISDFTTASDDIDLSGIDARASKGGDQKFTFDARGSSGTNVAEGHIGWYWVNKSGTADDRTILRINVDTDNTIEMQIELKGLINLSKFDFIL
jgi:Ca2+-binding RTX toxin-like protein